VAFVPNDLVAQANVRFLWAGQECENTLYFVSDFAADLLAIEALASDLTTYWQTNMLNLQHNTLKFVACEVKRLGAPADLTGTVIPTGTVNGGQTGDCLPNNVSIAISFFTGMSGKSFRGRNYWAGIPELQCVGNVIGDTYLGNIQTAYSGMVGVDNVSTGWTWCVYSRVSGGADRVTGLPTNISGCGFVDNIVDSQRRRLPGRGR